MDGTFQTFDSEARDVTLGDRLGRLTHLEAIFAKMAKEFPGNPQLVMQADAIRGATEVLRRVADEKGLFAKEYAEELGEAAALFKEMGARDSDLPGLYLA